MKTGNCFSGCGGQRPLLVEAWGAHIDGRCVRGWSVSCARAEHIQPFSSLAPDILGAACHFLAGLPLFDRQGCAYFDAGAGGFAGSMRSRAPCASAGIEAVRPSRTSRCAGAVHAARLAAHIFPPHVELDAPIWRCAGFTSRRPPTSNFLPASEHVAGVERAARDGDRQDRRAVGNCPSGRGRRIFGPM